MPPTVHSMTVDAAIDIISVISNERWSSASGVECARWAYHLSRRRSK